ADAYFHETADDDGRSLLPLYSAYRAMVRGAVEGMLLAEGEVGEAERHKALPSARAHWLLAFSELAGPEERPFLLLVGGLPGTGKSFLASELGNSAGFQVVRSDVVRKEMADGGAELYSAARRDLIYAECLRRAEALLFEGKRVIVDAT